MYEHLPPLIPVRQRSASTATASATATTSAATPATSSAANIKVLDETMSAYRPRTTKSGTLPYLSFILRKPEPLGTEFKTLATVGGFGTFTVCQCDLCKNMCED